MDQPSLRTLREARGFRTQESLASAARVSRCTIANLECGANTNPRQETLRGIATALGVDLAFLFSIRLASPDAEKPRRIQRTSRRKRRAA